MGIEDTGTTNSTHDNLIIDYTINDNNYLSVENTNLLAVGLTFPYSILRIENIKGELLCDIRQNKDGTVSSDLYNLDEAATKLFEEVIKYSQEYALSYIKDNNLNG